MLYLSLISLDPLQPNYSDEVDGWTDDALVTLCQLHKDDLDRFNSVHGVQKGAHWADIAQQMNSMGFTGPWFSSGKQVSMKWRYMLCQYKKVKNSDRVLKGKKSKSKYISIIEKVFGNDFSGLDMESAADNHHQRGNDPSPNMLPQCLSPKKEGFEDLGSTSSNDKQGYYSDCLDASSSPNSNLASTDIRTTSAAAENNQRGYNGIATAQNSENACQSSSQAANQQPRCPQSFSDSFATSNYDSSSQSFSQTVSDLTRCHQSTVSELTAQHNEHVMKLTEQHNQLVLSLTQAHQAHVSRLTANHQQLVQNITDKYCREISGIQNGLQQRGHVNHIRNGGPTSSSK